MGRREAADYDDEVFAEMLGEVAAAGNGLRRHYERPETPYGVTTNPKGSYPLESAAMDEFETEKHPRPAESEVLAEQAVAPDEAPAKGSVKDRGTPEGQIRTCAL